MQKNLFEVFLGLYNAESWIEDTFQYLETQTTDPFRVLMVDNASEDQTVHKINKIQEKYKLKNEYILIKNKKNIGPISSFLDRLNLFHSDWIFMIHQDDFYHQNHIAVLKEAIENLNDSVGIVFSGMKRMNAQNTEIVSPPTLATKLSATNRLQNFVLGLQISPINFPASALKKCILESVNTSRHTTTFNDMELLLRMMCISDVNYIPVETMHYRIYPGNASNLTSKTSVDRAVFVGLIEIFHSPEFELLISSVNDDVNLDFLLNGIVRAIEIRISDPQIKSYLTNVLAETLVRKFNYKNKNLNIFLAKSLDKMQLISESKFIRNLEFVNNFTEIKIEGIGPNKFSNISENYIKKTKLSNFSNKLNLSTRDKIFDLLFNSYLMSKVRRPFVRAWRSLGRNE